MSRKQTAMLAKAIKAEIAWRQWDKKWALGQLDANELSYPPKHYIEVGLARGQIQTARSLVKTGLVEWEGSDIKGQMFIKLNSSLSEVEAA